MRVVSIDAGQADLTQPVCDGDTRGRKVRGVAGTLIVLTIFSASVEGGPKDARAAVLDGSVPFNTYRFTFTENVRDVTTGFMAQRTRIRRVEVGIRLLVQDKVIVGRLKIFVQRVVRKEACGRRCLHEVLQRRRNCNLRDDSVGAGKPVTSFAEGGRLAVKVSGFDSFHNDGVGYAFNDFLIRVVTKKPRGEEPIAFLGCGACDISLASGVSCGICQVIEALFE